MITNRRNLILVSILIGTFGCVSFQNKVLNYGSIAQTSLESLSRIADQAVLDNTITFAQRQEFAKNYMVPATTVLDELITAAKSYKEGTPIPKGFHLMLDIVARAIDNFTAALPNGASKTSLVNELTSLRATLKNWIGDIQ